MLFRPAEYTDACNLDRADAVDEIRWRSWRLFGDVIEGEVGH
jgi:hypothetical protein